jgi:hypothetical protein
LRDPDRKTVMIRGMRRHDRYGGEYGYDDPH